MKTPPKKPQNRSRKSPSSRQGTDKRHKKDIRKLDRPSPVFRRLQINLGRLVTNLNTGSKVAAYQEIAARLSTLSGSDHSWTWNYIQCLHAGSIQPSKKFIRALDLYMQNFKPHEKRWFYFARRHSIASLYDKAILRETIRARFAEMGYKMIDHARFQKIKRAAIHR